MNRLFAIILFSIVSLSAFSVEGVEEQNITSLKALLEQVKNNGLSERAIHSDREAKFIAQKDKQKRALEQAQLTLNSVKKETARLKKLFSDNEDSLTKLDSELVKRTGNLGEMFGVVRQVSQDVAAIRSSSLLSIFIGRESKTLEELSASKSLPDIKRLEALWYELQLQMSAQGETSERNGHYINLQGVDTQNEIYNVGPFIAFNKNGYLSFDSSTGHFLELMTQPDGSELIESYLQSTEEFSDLYIDPTKGTLLAINSQAPDVIDRIKQGGLIGYIILAIGLTGVLYATVLLIGILKVNRSVNMQLADINTINLGNPLGRILSHYQDEKNETDLEALEMKLDEAVLKELPALEKGHSLIKLLAAVAPLLGLLGTVTGMIATFQSITLFGTGDPKLMASGISQALITTVLGLVAAIPLLFLHNILASKSREVIQILDQQSAGLIAQKSQAI